MRATTKPAITLIAGFVRLCRKAGRAGYFPVKEHPAAEPPRYFFTFHLSPFIFHLSPFPNTPV